MIWTLEELKKQAFEMRSAWNGKESGRAEELASIGEEIEQNVAKIEELLEEAGLDI